MTTRGSSAFVERTWAESRIGAWLVSENPALVLTGPPGSGKSTLMGRLAKIGVRPAAVHVCRARVLSTSEPIPVLAGIARALARSVPGYAETVIRQQPWSWRDAAANSGLDGPELARLAVLDSADHYTAYERGLRQPLSALAASGELGGDLVVGIDGLDEESIGGRGNELADLLATQSHRAVPFLRLLMSTRPGPIADRLRAVPSLDLADDPSTVDTIATVLQPLSRQSGRTQQTIAKAAQGSFVYALLAAGSRDLKGKPPAGMAALYELVLGGLDSVAADVLGVICQGRDQGLSPSRLADILQIERRAVDAVVEKHRRVLLGDKLLKPYHRCLADYVMTLSRPASRRIADYLVDRWRGRWAKCDEAYALRNVVPHLADAAFSEWAGGRRPGNSVSAGAILRDTLNDPAYLTTALATVGLDELRAALSYARYRTAGTPADVDIVPILAKILHGEARTVRGCRSGVVATRQLVYAAATVGATDLAQRLALGGTHGEVETLWATADLMTDSSAQAIRGHRAHVTALTVAANGTQAFSAAMDGKTLLWRLASGRLTNSLSTPAQVTAVRAGPDAEHVLTAYADGTLQRWNPTTGEKRRITAPTVEVTAFAVANDGSRVVTGDPDCGLTVWDHHTAPEPLLRLPYQSGRVTAVAMTADGRHVAAASEPGDVTVWDLKTGWVRLRLHHGCDVTALCLTPRADRIVVGDAESATVHAIPNHGDTKDAESWATETVVGRLATRAAVTALAANPAMPSDIMFGTALGQVAYLRVP